MALVGDELWSRWLAPNYVARCQLMAVPSPPHGPIANLWQRLRSSLWGQQLAKDQETLSQAERWANTDQFHLAVQILDNLIYRWDSQETAWSRWWRRWQSQPVADRAAILRTQWQQAINNYQREFGIGQQAAAAGDFSLAQTQASLALEHCEHEAAVKLLDQAQQALQCEAWFGLGLAAEAAKDWETARYHYQNILNQLSLPPRSVKFCRDRLLHIAARNQDWQEVTQLTENYSDQEAAHYLGLIQLQQQQQAQLTALRQIQASLNLFDIPTARTKVANYFERFGADLQIQQALTSYGQSQWFCAPEDWPGRCQIAQSLWLDSASHEVLHDWAVAAYYRSLGAPERLDWLIELLPIWVTALLNFHLDPPLAQLPWFDKLTEPLTTTDLVKILEPLVDSVADLEQRQEIQLRWQRETLALEWLGNPPDRGVRVAGNFLSPGFYEYFQDKFQAIELPAAQWATLYTPWWQAILACREGRIARAMRAKPANRSQDPATSYAAQFVAYHEGCYYLKSQRDSFARWREAVPHLELAQPLIAEDYDWWEQVDLLCDQHHAMIWRADDRRAFGEFWHRLLQSHRAMVFLELVTAEAAEEEI
jgi:hypothetical protein